MTQPIQPPGDSPGVPGHSPDELRERIRIHIGWAIDRLEGGGAAEAADRILVLARAHALLEE